MNPDQNFISNYFQLKTKNDFIQNSKPNKVRNLINMIESSIDNPDVFTDRKLQVGNPGINTNNGESISRNSLNIETMETAGHPKLQTMKTAGHPNIYLDKGNPSFGAKSSLTESPVRVQIANREDILFPKDTRRDQEIRDLDAK